MVCLFDFEGSSPGPLNKTKKDKKIHCVLTKNLRDNHSSWVAKIKEEEKIKEAAALKEGEIEVRKTEMILTVCIL